MFWALFFVPIYYKCDVKKSSFIKQLTVCTRRVNQFNFKIGLSKKMIFSIVSFLASYNRICFILP